MLDSPNKTFGGVVAFLGLTVTRDRLNSAIRRSSFRVLQEQEKRQGFVEKSEAAERFFREGKSGQWRKLLTKEQVESVVAAHQDQMARFGYWPLPE
jgi:hypothetical protein